MALFFAKPHRKAPVLEQREIVMEGWLYKRSGVGKPWKRRWCVLSPRYLCTFEEQTMDYKKPTAWVRIGECWSPIADANKTSFSVKSVDHTLLLAAMSYEEKDIWIAEICKQFTHDWEPIVTGARFPKGAVCSQTGSGDCALVARNSKGECGEMTVLSGKTGEIRCHHYGSTDRGEVLVPRDGTTFQWLAIKRGDPLPDFAVYAGKTRRDCKLYVGRNESGQLGKINLEAGTFWNLWIPSGHRSEGRHELGEVLVILPVDGWSPSGAISPSFDNPERSAEAFMANLEPVSKNGRPFEFWRTHMAELRSQGNNVDLGRCFANPPIESVLGKGAFGRVWRGQDQSTGEVFAVKNMLTKAKSMQGKVAMNELKVADKIKNDPHPCIVGLFLVQHFELNNCDLYMLVMEFCAGGDLQERLEAAIVDGVYTVPKQALTWIGQIFLALEHLHLRVGALIRDLKPGNVVLSRSDSAKLTDFGYGRLFTQSDGSWSYGAPPGSPGYIAPEILSQEQYDWRVDLYSFAVLTWVLLSGGVCNAELPLPPAAYASARGFSDFKNDWKLMADCLEHPEKGRCNISKEAFEMISALTRRNPLERLNHGELRQTQFMKALRIPEPHAEPGAVEAWRRQARIDTSDSEELDSRRSSQSPCLFSSFTTVESPLPNGGVPIEMKTLVTDGIAVEDISEDELTEACARVL